MLEMIPARVRFGLFALSLGGACGGDDHSSGMPGKELGPCVQEQFCESPLQCVGQICVHPDQVGDGTDSSVDDGGGASPNSDGDDGQPSTSSGTSTGGTSYTTGDSSDHGSDGDGAGTPIYCTPGETEGCFCGHTADYGPEGTACSQTTVTAPGRCCASEGWPVYGGCSCWTQSCRQISSDTCYCGIGSVDLEDGDQPVDSCSSSEGICCLDEDQGSCTCWESLTACLEGSTPVSSCSVSSLGCGSGNSVAACN
jgi:hypothetical protein